MAQSQETHSEANGEVDPRTAVVVKTREKYTVKKAPGAREEAQRAAARRGGR